MGERADLNALLRAALARGEKPFRCWACGDWFTETAHSGGRPRVICEAPACVYARQRYLAFGVLPGQRYESEARQHRTMLARAILRAVEADWLTDKEIAEELGCAASMVSDVRHRTGLRRTRIRSAA